MTSQSLVRLDVWIMICHPSQITLPRWVFFIIKNFIFRETWQTAPAKQHLLHNISGRDPRCFLSFVKILLFSMLCYKLLVLCNALLWMESRISAQEGKFLTALLPWFSLGRPWELYRSCLRRSEITFTERTHVNHRLLLTCHIKWLVVFVRD